MALIQKAEWHAAYYCSSCCHQRARCGRRKGAAAPSKAQPSSQPSRRVLVKALKGEEPLRVVALPEGVQIEILQEGDGKTFPKQFVEANVIGRLPTGNVFESNEGKGRPPMKMQLGGGAIIPGMELGLRHLSLGAQAVLRIPSKLGYRNVGVPRVIPPDSDLTFEVHVVGMDGASCLGSTEHGGTGKSDINTAMLSSSSTSTALFKHPWWLCRVQRPPPTAYYLSFCRHLARSLPPEVLERARAIPRKSRAEAADWTLTGCACVIGGVQDLWKARKDWTLDWMQKNLGNKRALVKWQGPVFTKQEALWDNPVWETSVSEYIDYVKEVDATDPLCEEQNAAACPRLYLNGWSVFKQLPWMRKYLDNPTFLDDCSGDIIDDHEALRESFIASLSKDYIPPPEAKRQAEIDDEYWEFTKLFISPKGAITRLHFDNGGAHAWLSQVRGRKLFVCYAPNDGPQLHPFEGDEGLLNGSWIDPLDADVLKKWPKYATATPYISVVEEGETLVAPQGWWHYAVALDASITVMRNFYTTSNRHEFIGRKDAMLKDAIANNVLKKQQAMQGQPDEKLKQIASQVIKKLRGMQVAPVLPRLPRSSFNGITGT